MSRFRPAGRALLVAALVSVPAAASAQAFRLDAPSLSVDGRRVGVDRAALSQDPFETLALDVPGAGTYRVAARPFDGARAVGQFDGDGLFFALDGRSVRLRSRGPILDAGAPAPAFVRLDPSADGRTRGPARLSVSGAQQTPIRLASADRRPAFTAQPVLDGDAARLRAQLDRAREQRRVLEAERDRLRAERSLTGTAGAERTAAERDRLRAERDQLAAARDRAQSERDRLAADLDAARRRADAAEQAGRQADALAARDETGRLRALVVARDETIATLQTERADRDARLAAAEAGLTEARRALYVALADRDRALAARDVALARSGPESARVGRLETERDQLAAERDRAFRERDALLAGRAAIDDDRAALAADRAALAAERVRLDAAGASTVGLAERQRLLDQIAEAQAERDALRLQVSVLQEERDALSARLDRLSADLAGARRAPAMPAAPRTAPRGTDAPGRDGAVAYLPGFDFARLRNSGLIRRRLDEAEYPRVAQTGRIDGDVLVLFETDREGRVIRTAVASPIGGGLDGLAESVVRDMHFVPPVVNGIDTGLRSQVLVRFEM